MKSSILTILLVLSFISTCRHSDAAEKAELIIVIIRHAEKSDANNNLSCKGFNRALMLPAVLYKKFGIPDKIYVPAVGAGATTKHLRMLQTITPLAIKYHVPINSQFDENDSDHLGEALSHEKGLIIVAWEHTEIPPVIRWLVPAANRIHWRDDDYDSIYIISFKTGNPTLSFDTEHINPTDNCNF